MSQIKNLFVLSLTLTAALVLLPTSHADGFNYFGPPVRPQPPRPSYPAYPAYPAPGPRPPVRPMPPTPVVIRPPAPRPPVRPQPFPQPAPRPRPGQPSYPGYSGETESIEVNKLVTYIMRGKGCERAGDALREMSNLLLSSANFSARPGSPAPDQIVLRSGEREEDARRRWAAHVHSRTFWEAVWKRLAQLYRGCNRACFDDGLAIGQISATGYCAASVELGGLDAPGFQAQLEIPVCEIGNFTGCLDGYDRAASTYDGCSAYMGGNFRQIYNQSKSLDCHVPY